jgi:hypothetical protein
MKKKTNERLKNIARSLKIKLPGFECPDIGQTPGEIINTLKIVKQLNPGVVLEIGSARGGFIYLLSAALNYGEERTIITIDPWSQGTKYEKQYKIFKKTIGGLRRIYPKNSYIHIRGRSEENGVVKKLKNTLKNKKINFLFIDGKHTYESVLGDWKNYRQFLGRKSVIAFHDIAEYKEVAKAWQKITKENKDYFKVEFRKKGIPLLSALKKTDLKFSTPLILGIGYLCKKDESNKKLIQILKKS